MPATPQPELPFVRLGEWDVLSPIAEGGMARVYLGRKEGPPTRFAALKVIRPELCRDDGFVSMFVDEGRIATLLAHPSVASVYEVGHDGTRQYLAMELLLGRTLLELWDALRARGQRMPLPLAAWLGARVAEALHHVHELRSPEGKPLEPVHRDVNPANVFVTYSGEPKLIDFGLAKAHDRMHSTGAGVVKGKLAYLSPEQTLGKPADRRADVFALGVLLWELTVDRRLFKVGDDVETVRRVQSADVPDPRTIDPAYPERLAMVLAGALAREPEARYQTAAELAAALDAFAAGERAEPSALAALMADVFPDTAAPPWERLLAPPSPGELLVGLDGALAGRKASEPLVVARVLLERALVDEILGDGSRAKEHAEASLRASPTTAAHVMLRRLLHSRETPRATLEHLDAEIEACASESARADLLAERARVLAAAGEKPKTVRAAWERALAADPEHPAALAGLEGALASEPGAASASSSSRRSAQREASLAAHLARMASAYEAEPKLAAWLLVERARLLDGELGEVDAARAALDRALSLDPGLGPVRDAAVLFAAVHRDASASVALLSREAELTPALTTDSARAARLLLDAATLARHRLADETQAALLLESASARTPASPLVERRILDDLVELHEAAGRTEDALRVRRRRLESSSGSAVVEELRAIAALEEARGDLPAAVEALERAHASAEHDEAILGELDRVLARASRDARRIELWATEAARVPAGASRARLLVRAARLAESTGELGVAIDHLRAALVASPGDAEAVERLTRLLASPPSAAVAEEARARIAVYLHAAEHAEDAARRVAYLEAAALLQEEALGDAALAAATYARIVDVEPGRRTALLGLARAATRTGDAEKLARALLEEAKVTAGDAKDDLAVRAADALAETSADRALSLVLEVLARTPAHAAGRALEQRLHEGAGRWGKVDASLAARVASADVPAEKAALLLARAEVQRTRLRAPREALASVREASKLVPGDAGVRAALLPLLAALKDARAARDALVDLASTAASPLEKAQDLARAAELDEHVALDDAHALELYERALAASPDAWLQERRARVAARLRHADKGAEEAAKVPPPPPANGEGAGARDVVALRELERAARQARSAPMLANALALQADAYHADAPKLAALWAEAALVEWSLPEAPADDQLSDLMAAILARTPADRAALDAVVRLDLPRARGTGGGAKARARLVAALIARLAQATDDTTRLVERLTLALVLEGDEQRAREALHHYREALRIDSLSVVAAAGCARLGASRGDAEAAVAGAVAEAELAPDPAERARALSKASGWLLAATDPRLGSRAERLVRAAWFLDLALDADPESEAAARALVSVRKEQGGRDPLVAALRGALSRAKSAPAVIFLGGALAAVAVEDPPDRILAIDSLRRVLGAAPGDAPTLRALADLYLAQQAWGDAAEALEALAAAAEDAPVKLQAFFDLAELEEKTLRRPDRAERALRAAVAADPTSVRALRALLALRRAACANAAEIAALTAAWAAAETEPSAKSAALVALAEAELEAGNRAGGEAALVEAAALSAGGALLGRLLMLHEGAPAEQARVLEAVVGRGEAQGRVDPSYLAALGQLEVDVLGQIEAGVAHLRVAIGLAPAMHEARAALARGLVELGQGEAALALLTPMIADGAAPLLALRDPAAALLAMENALVREARREEAAVARELRAIAGGVDDAPLLALRARRHPEHDPSAPVPTLFERQGLLAALAPPDARGPLLEVGASLAGIESKLVRTDLGDLTLGPRDVLPPGSGHPAALLVQRVARMLGTAPPPVVVLSQIDRMRVAILDPLPFLLLPESLFARPTPVQTAAVARGVVRVLLGMAWAAELGPEYVHALLCGMVRQVAPDFGHELGEANQDLVEEYARRIRRVIGRRQKKALGAALAQPIAPPTRAEVSRLLLALRQIEARAAFVFTGDLFATLDELSLGDASLARAGEVPSVAALGAVLAHPVAGDTARFGMTGGAGGATALRWRAGTLWGAPR